jgi:hypothetical protein
MLAAYSRRVPPREHRTPGPRWIEYRKLSDIIPADRNPKQHDLPALKRMVTRFGYTAPVLQDERTGKLVAGHGRVETLADLKSSGQDPPAGVSKDGNEWLVPVVRGWASRSDTEAEAYILADNQGTILGGLDSDLASLMLADIALVDPTLPLDSGFDDAEIAKLLSSDPLPDEGDAPTDNDGPMAYGVIVECDTEAQQARLLERLDSEGFSVRALMGGA